MIFVSFVVGLILILCFAMQDGDGKLREDLGQTEMGIRGIYRIGENCLASNDVPPAARGLVGEECYGSFPQGGEIARIGAESASRD